MILATGNLLNNNSYIMHHFLMFYVEIKFVLYIVCVCKFETFRILHSEWVRFTSKGKHIKFVI
jgi:hypothetical protein